MVVVYQRTSDDFGLTVSIPKTKHMAAGRLVDESDQEPIELVGGDVVAVDDLPYLGSVIAGSGRMDVDVDRRVAQASKAFGAQSHCNQLSGCCGRGGLCVCVCFFPAMVGLSRGRSAGWEVQRRCLAKLYSCL